MADDEKLIIPLGFSLDFTEAEQAWKNKQAELQKMFTTDIKLNIKLPTNNNLDKLETVINRLKEIKLEPITPETKAAIATLTAELKNLEAILISINKLNAQNAKATASLNKAAAQTSKELTAAKINEAKARDISAKAELNEQKTAQQRILFQQKQQAAADKVIAAEQRLVDARNKGTRAIHTQNSALQRQAGLLNGMPQFLNAYISVLGTMRLVDNIRKVTAEFELQRVALTAIIQNKREADKLFSQALDLAVVSPFTAKELITDIKQLAAFRIETDQLYDTTKRLADVSAGLGVDMGRLILAYGQVSAASVLRGQEIRQFTEAGVPLIQMLADKFTILKNRVVDTSEVFDLVSKRQVPFAMVADIFKELTDEGGMFFNMQQIQAQTLSGIYANLSDNIQQAFYRIGDSQMSVFKGAGLLATEIVQHLDAILDAGVLVVGMWSAQRIAVKLSTQVLGAEYTATVKSAMANKQKNAALLEQAAAYRRLSVSEQQEIATKKTLTAADIEGMRISGAAKKELALRAYATRRLSMTEAERAVGLKIFTAWEMQSVTVLGKGRVAMLALRTAVGGLLTSIKALSLAMIKNPLTWIFAAAGLVMSQVAAARERAEQLREITQATSEALRQFSKDVTEQYTSAKNVIERGISQGATIKEIDAAKAAFEALLSQNKELTPIIMERISKISDEKLRLLELKKIWEEIATAASTPADPSWLANAAAESGVGRGATQGIVADPGFAQRYKGDFKQANQELIKSFDELDKKIAKVNTTSDALSATQMSAWRELIQLFREGGITYEELYVKAKKFGSSGVARNLGEEGSNSLKSIIGYADVADRSLTKMFENMQANAREFDGKLPDFFNLKKAGLSDVGYTQFAQQGIISTDVYLESIGQGLATGIPMMRNALLGGFQIPKADTTKAAEVALSGWKGAFQAASYTTMGWVTKVVESVNKAGETIKTEAKEWGKVNMPLFDRQTIENMTTYDDGVKAVSETINELTASIVNLENRLANKNIFSLVGIEETEAELATFKARLASAQDLARMENIKPVVKGGGSDTRASQLNAEISLIKEAYARYEKLRKVMTDSSAQNEITRLYGVAMSQFQKLGKETKPVFSSDDLVKELERALKVGNNYLDSKGKLQIQAEIADATLDDIERQLKRKLDEIAKDISRQGIANDFYEKILASTGSTQLAASLTLSTTGLNMADVRSKLVDALKTTMRDDKGIEIPLVWKLDEAGNQIAIDINAMQEIIRKLPETTQKEAQSALDALLKYNQDSISSLYSTLGKYETFQERIQAALAQTQADIDKINASELPVAEKTRLTHARTTQGDKVVATIQLEELKGTDEYIKAFEDLGNVGNRTLIELETRLKTFLELSKQSLDPTQIREIVKQIEKIQDTLQERNPWQTFTDGLREYREALVLMASDQETMMQDAATLAGARANEEEAQVAVDAAQGDEARAVALRNLEIAHWAVDTAQTHAANSSKAYAASQNKAYAAHRKMVNGMNKTKAKFDDLAGVIRDSISITSELADGLGIAFGDEATAAIEAFEKALSMVSAGYALITAAIAMQGTATVVTDAASKSLMSTLWPLLVIAVLLAAAFFFLGAKQRALKEEIEESETRVKRLEWAYADLERQFDKMMGLDKYKLIGKEVENLYRQQAELLKQADLESQKGKKKDKGRIEELRRSAFEITQEIEDRIAEVREEILGGTTKDFAEQLGQALFDSLADGRKMALQAWNETVDEIIANMVRKFLIMKLIEEPLNDILNNFWENAYTDTSDLYRQKVEAEANLANAKKAQKETIMKLEQVGTTWVSAIDEAATLRYRQRAAALAEQYTKQIQDLQGAIDEAETAGAQMTAENLGELDLALKKLGEDRWNMLQLEELKKFLAPAGEGNLTGISKEVGALSEDTALTLAAIANSSLYYNVGSYNMLFSINDILMRWELRQTEAVSGGQPSTIAGMIALQSQALAIIQGIKSDTERIALAAESVASNLDAVIGPLGSRSGAKAINTNT